MTLHIIKYALPERPTAKGCRSGSVGDGSVLRSTSQLPHPSTQEHIVFLSGEWNSMDCVSTVPLKISVKTELTHDSIAGSGADSDLTHRA